MVGQHLICKHIVCNVLKFVQVQVINVAYCLFKNLETKIKNREAWKAIVIGLKRVQERISGLTLQVNGAGRLPPRSEARAFRVKCKPGEKAIPCSTRRSRTHLTGLSVGSSKENWDLTVLRFRGIGGSN